MAQGLAKKPISGFPLLQLGFKWKPTWKATPWSDSLVGRLPSAREKSTKMTLNVYHEIEAIRRRFILFPEGVDRRPPFSLWPETLSTLRMTR